ncbi:MAG: alginate lyase family protein, partial [Planctomycetota bacterium]|nr:alginate lyase family protein [Planctomycetota bacterium]
MKLSALARTFRTVRHLRPAQVYWRLRYRRERARPLAVPRVPTTIELRKDFPEVPLAGHGSKGDGFGPKENHGREYSGDEVVGLMEQGCFSHLNMTKLLGRSPVDWLLGTAVEDRLWTITLHYHAWAWDLAQRVVAGGGDAHRADACLRRLLADWIANCDLAAEGSRDLAWNSYAISTRLGWWCRLYHRLGGEGRKNWCELENKFLASLWQQAAFLSGHIEWDLRANHMLRDAVGLAWAGRFFAGSEAEQWLQAATEMALSQADEQVLADGGHFERSPMYHVHAMDDFLVLGTLIEEPRARQSIRETWQKMAEFLAWTRHPDGQIPLFNDGGLNGACHPREMLWAGCRAFGVDVDAQPRKGGKLFESFGLVAWHGEPWSMFFDVGPVGVDYQPGHAHADTLSIEASFEGERLFIDPGTFGYDNDDARRYDRATVSHNTLCVDATDSSEVWHIFRVGRRARPTDVNCDVGEKFLRATGS